MKGIGRLHFWTHLASLPSGGSQWSKYWRISLRVLGQPPAWVHSVATHPISRGQRRRPVRSDQHNPTQRPRRLGHFVCCSSDPRMSTSLTGRGEAYQTSADTSSHAVATGVLLLLDIYK